MGLRSKEKFLVFGAPDIQAEDIEEVCDSLRSGWIGTGPKVARFEQAFRAYKGGERSVAAVSSCTAALHLSLLAAGVGPGDEVITTSLTFCSTVNAILHAGATPVLVDVDPRTMNIDPAEIERQLTPRTKACVAVHFAGRACDMAALTSLCEKHSLTLVEDCAHAIETEYHGEKAGTFGDFSCFSFYATKNMTTGEGGMVLARKPADTDRIKMLALHGLTRDAWRRYQDQGHYHYKVEDIGFKYNMTDLQAALGIHQLARLEANWVRREQIWQRYIQAFAGLPLGLPAPVESHTRHAYHLFTILLDESLTGVPRDTFLRRMTDLHIGVGVHYLSIPEHPIYQQKLGCRTADFPHASLIGQQTASLPLSARLSDEDVGDVIEAVHRSLGAN